MEKKEIPEKVKAVHGDGLVLAKMFGVTNNFVSCCLNGKSNTELAIRIRMAAVARGGYPIYHRNNKYNKYN